MNEKLELIQQVEEKGVDIDDLAQTIEFSPMLLRLYMVKDGYPIPTRIAKKISEALAA